ncbi:MAG: hypothetical protein AAGI12_11745 [Pseudomonadota bacterium]
MSLDDETNHLTGAGSLTIICSDCPRNGKTLFAKLACDLVRLRRGDAPQIFDTDEPDGGLAAHFPDTSTIVDLAKTPQRVGVIDGMLSAKDTAFVIDLADRHYTPFFSMCADIGFVEGAREVGLDVTVFFVVDRTVRSVEALIALNETFRDLRVVPVLNTGIGHGINEPAIAKAFDRQHFERVITLPDLSADALGMMEHVDFHFDAFVAGRYEHFPFELRAELWDFLETLYAQRDQAEDDPARAL